MKLSIIVPAYNMEAYLSKCLDSVIYPSIPDYEIIVVNDGSSDKTEAIAASYVERYPALIRLITTENGGLGAARNVGISAARGEFLLFLDSDDYMVEDAVEELLCELNGNIDICIFDLAAVNDNGVLIKNMPGCTRTGAVSLDTYPELLIQPQSACNKVCRRTLFLDNNIYFPGKVWFEDLRTMPKLYLFTDRIVYIDKPWYNYLQRSGSITNNKNTARNLEIIDAVDDLISFYRQNGVYEKYEAQLEYVAFYNQFLTSSTRVNLADSKSEVQDLLMEDFLRKYPDFQRNPYVKKISFQHRLLTFLLLHKRRSAVNILMRLNNLIKHKNVNLAAVSDAPSVCIANGFPRQHSGSEILLSIIIPAYNMEDYIEKCLDSSLVPSLGNYEIIVVNDGSIDKTEAIAASYVERYPTLIRLISTPNSGVGAARNIGINAAKGEYILFLDSDDYLTHGAVPEILAMLNPDVDIIIFDFVSVNPSGSKIKEVHGCEKTGSVDLSSCPELLIQLPAAWNKICRRSLFTDNELYFPARVWFEDLRTMPKIFLYTDKIYSVHKSWYNYLQRSGSITNSKNTERNLEIIDAVDDLISFYRENGRFEQFRPQLEYMAFYNEFLTSSTRVNLADYNSPVQDTLMLDFFEKFPDFRENKYVRNMSIQHKMLTALLLRRRWRAVNILMRLNNIIKGKNL